MKRERKCFQGRGFDLDFMPHGKPSSINKAWQDPQVSDAFSTRIGQYEIYSMSIEQASRHTLQLQNLRLFFCLQRGEALHRSAVGCSLLRCFNTSGITVDPGGSHQDGPWGIICPGTSHGYLL